MCVKYKRVEDGRSNVVRLGVVVVCKGSRIQKLVLFFNKPKVLLEVDWDLL